MGFTLKEIIDRLMLSDETIQLLKTQNDVISSDNATLKKTIDRLTGGVQPLKAVIDGEVYWLHPALAQKIGLLVQRDTVRAQVIAQADKLIKEGHPLQAAEVLGGKMTLIDQPKPKEGGRKPVILMPESYRNGDK